MDKVRRSISYHIPTHIRSLTHSNRIESHLHPCPLPFPSLPVPFLFTFQHNTKAKLLLGYAPRHKDFAADMAAELAEYKAAYGGDTWGLDEVRYDLEILASMDDSFALDYSFITKI